MSEAERVARLESQMHALMGNGQPGLLDKMDMRWVARFDAQEAKLADQRRKDEAARELDKEAHAKDKKHFGIAIMAVIVIISASGSWSQAKAILEFLAGIAK